MENRQSRKKSALLLSSCLQARAADVAAGPLYLNIRPSNLIKQTVDLLERSHTKHFHFLLGQITPVATTQVLLCQSGKLYAVEFDHSVSEMLEYAADDAVLAAVYLYAHLTLVGIVGIFDCIGMDLSVFQLYSVRNLLQVVGCNVLVEEDVVHFLLEILRMGQLAGQIAVVCKQEYAGSVAVESSYWVDTFWANTLYDVHYGLALLRIVARSDTVLWLVEQYVHLLFQVYWLVFELDFVCALHLSTEFGNRCTVYGHYSCLDKLVGLAAAAYSGIGEEFVQTYRFIGIDIVFFIFDAFLQTILSVGVIVGRVLTLSVTAMLIAATVVAALLAVAITVFLITTLLTVAVAALLIAATVVATQLTGLITALLLVVTLRLVVAWAITALLLTRLITALLITALLIAATAVATLLARLIAALLAFALLAVARAVAALLLTRLIAATVVAALLTVAVAALLIAATVVAALLTRMIAAGTCTLL